ncbi:MAG: toll/interleukin-1 receptor domain-containing protein [Myxococcota bacterium]
MSPPRPDSSREATSRDDAPASDSVPHEPYNGPIRVFVSYSRLNYTPAALVASHLREYRGVVDVWMDDDLSVGERYPGTIVRELARADVFVAILSRAFFESEWCTRESETFLDRAASDPRLLVVPIAIDGMDLPKHPICSWQVVDLPDWAIRADRVLRQRVLPVILREKVPASSVAVALTEAAAGRRARVYSDVLRYCSTTRPPAEVVQGLVGEAFNCLSNEELSPGARADLSNALSAIFLNRGEWRTLANLNAQAIQLIGERAGDRPLTDEELAFEGELYNHLALAERKLRVQSAEAHYLDATRAFGAIRDPLFRREKMGQVLRERGNLALRNGQLEAAGAFYRSSVEALEGLPSQRWHVLAGKSKLALVSALKGDVHTAQQELAVIEPEFSVDALRGGGERAWAAADQFWYGSAIVAIIAGTYRTSARWTATHGAFAREQGWANASRKVRWLGGIGFLAVFLPRRVRTALFNQIVRFL